MTRKNPYYEHKYPPGHKGSNGPDVAGDYGLYDDTVARVYSDPEVSVQDSNYDQPEGVVIEYEECYADGPPQYTAPGEVRTLKY